MARATLEAWIPEDRTGPAITRINQTSAVEALGKSIPMSTNTKEIPRSGDVDVDIIPKGSAYGEDTNTPDTIILTAKKFGKAIRLAEEDLDDTAGFVNVLDDKKTAWGRNYAIMFDNACLGTNAAIGTDVPFTSVYRAVTTADATTGYTANTNLVKTAGALTYAKMSQVLGLYEGSLSYDEGNTFVIAHPSFKGLMRDLVDGQSRPLFVEGQGNVNSTFFGLPVRWSLGAKVSTVATPNPAAYAGGAVVGGTAGNPLLIVGNPEHLLVGKRSGPESVVIDGRSGLSALTDETILKMRARRAFGTPYPDAFAVLERTGA